MIALGAVTSTDHVMSPHVFGPGVVDADEFLNTVEPWIETAPRGLDYMFQQDSASSYGQEKTGVVPTKLQHGVDQGHVVPRAKSNGLLSVWRSTGEGK